MNNENRRNFARKSISNRQNLNNSPMGNQHRQFFEQQNFLDNNNEFKQQNSQRSNKNGDSIQCLPTNISDIDEELATTTSPLNNNYNNNNYNYSQKVFVVLK